MIQPEILAVFFFVKMVNWHIGRDKENLVFTKKGRKIMKKSKNYMRNFTGHRQNIKKQKATIDARNDSFSERHKTLIYRTPTHGKIVSHKSTSSSIADRQCIKNFPYASDNPQVNWNNFCSQSSDAKSLLFDDKNCRNTVSLNLEKKCREKMITEAQARVKMLQSSIKSLDKIVINQNELALEVEKLKSYKLSYWPILRNGVLTSRMDKYDDYTVFSILNMGDKSYDIELESFADFRGLKEPFYAFNTKITVYPNVTEPNMLPDFEIREFDLPCGIAPDKNDKTKFHKVTEETRREDEYNYLYSFRILMTVFGLTNHFSLHTKTKITDSKNFKKKATSELQSPSFSSDETTATKKNFAQRAITLNGIKIISLTDECQMDIISRPHRKLTESWTVRGHYRHYASGKVVYVKPYTKGTGKKTAKTYKFASNI